MSFRNSRSQLFHSRNVKQTLHSLYNRFEGYPKYVYSLRVTCTGKVQAIVEAPFDDTMEQSSGSSEYQLEDMLVSKQVTKRRKQVGLFGQIVKNMQRTNLLNASSPKSSRTTLLKFSTKPLPTKVMSPAQRRIVPNLNSSRRHSAKKQSSLYAKFIAHDLTIRKVKMMTKKSINEQQANNGQPQNNEHLITMCKESYGLIENNHHKPHSHAVIEKQYELTEDNNYKLQSHGVIEIDFSFDEISERRDEQQRQRQLKEKTNVIEKENSGEQASQQLKVISIVAPTIEIENKKVEKDISIKNSQKNMAKEILQSISRNLSNKMSPKAKKSLQMSQKKKNQFQTAESTPTDHNPLLGSPQNKPAGAQGKPISGEQIISFQRPHYNTLAQPPNLKQSQKSNKKNTNDSKVLPTVQIIEGAQHAQSRIYQITIPDTTEPTKIAAPDQIDIKFDLDLNFV